MLDEFDKPLEQDNANQYGEDAEAPIVSQVPKSTSHERHANKKATTAKSYIRPALDRLRPVWLSTWVVAKSPNFWSAIATVVIAVSTIFYTVYAKRQWQEIQSGSTDTHKLALAAQTQAAKAETISTSIAEAVTQLKATADATNGQLTFAQQQAKAAQDSVRAIQEQTRIDQRAWMVVNAPVRPQVGPDPTFGTVGLWWAAIAKNIGKTTARQCSVVATIAIVKDGERPAFDYPGGRTKQFTFGILAPNDVSQITIPLMESDGTQKVLTPAEVQDQREGRTYLVMYGKSSYETFGHQHWQHFCVWFTDDPNPGQVRGAGACTRYNDVDNN